MVHINEIKSKGLLGYDDKSLHPGDPIEKCKNYPRFCRPPSDMPLGIFVFEGVVYKCPFRNIYAVAAVDFLDRIYINPDWKDGGHTEGEHSDNWGCDPLSNCETPKKLLKCWIENMEQYGDPRNGTYEAVSSWMVDDMQFTLTTRWNNTVGWLCSDEYYHLGHAVIDEKIGIDGFCEESKKVVLKRMKQIRAQEKHKVNKHPIQHRASVQIIDYSDR